jgi:hypothetical protein
VLSHADSSVNLDNRQTASHVALGESRPRTHLVRFRLAHHQQIPIRILEYQEIKAASICHIANDLNIVLLQKLFRRGHIARPEEADRLHRGARYRLMSIETELRLPLNWNIENSILVTELTCIDSEYLAVPFSRNPNVTHWDKYLSKAIDNRTTQSVLVPLSPSARR